MTGRQRRMQIICLGLNAIASEAEHIDREHGFVGNSFGEDIAKLHAEVSEAMQDWRNGHEPTEMWTAEPWTARPGDKPCGIPYELADVIISALALAKRHGIDIELAVARKLAYNETRPKNRHGGKRL